MARAREAAGRARDMTRRKNVLDIAGLPESLQIARKKTQHYASYFWSRVIQQEVRNKQARDRKPSYFATFRCNLNVEKARFDKMLASAEVGTLITALAAAPKEEHNPDKLRYHSIIIMTRRCRWFTHTHLVAHFFQANARADRKRPHLHRSATTIQSRKNESSTSKMTKQWTNTFLGYPWTTLRYTIIRFTSHQKYCT